MSSTSTSKPVIRVTLPESPSPVLRDILLEAAKVVPSGITLTSRVNPSSVRPHLSLETTPPSPLPSISLPTMKQMMAMPDTLTHLKMAFLRATRALSGKAQEAPSGAYTLSSSRDDAERWLRERVGKVRRLVFDIETAGGLKLHPAKREILCVGLFDGAQTFIIPEDQLYGPDYEDGGDWPELYDLLSKFGLVGHNAKFDTMTLSYVLIRRNQPLKVDFDTQIVHGILYPAAQKHALDYVVEKFYGWQSWSL